MLKRCIISLNDTKWRASNLVEMASKLIASLLLVVMASKLIAMASSYSPLSLYILFTIISILVTTVSGLVCVTFNTHVFIASAATDFDPFSTFPYSQPDAECSAL